MSRGPGRIEQARYAALSERGKSEKVHYGSRFILRIPVQFMAGRSNPLFEKLKRGRLLMRILLLAAAALMTIIVSVPATFDTADRARVGDSGPRHSAPQAWRFP
jgi:hypothetical protein